MTPKLIETSSWLVPAPVRQSASNGLSPREAEHERADQSWYVVVQLALKIEVPPDDIDSFTAAGVIVISLCRG